MATTRYLIVNADDFGRNPGVNLGIIKAHEQGIVTAASLMVRWPAATEAADYCRGYRDLSLGLHFDFGEWVCRNGTWLPVYQVVFPENVVNVTEEVSRQLESFRALVGRDPTHIDSHQHFHRREPFRSALLAIASELKIPLRDCSPEVRYCGGFYGQTAEGAPNPEAITVEGLIKILAALEPGLTELGCHPGEGDDLDETYCSEREQEVKTLCNLQVQAAIASMEIELCSFGRTTSNSERSYHQTGGDF